MTTEQYPGLRLTFDVSQCCTVHESFLDDQPETLTLGMEGRGWCALRAVGSHR